MMFKLKMFEHVWGETNVPSKRGWSQAGGTTPNEQIDIIENITVPHFPWRADINRHLI